MTSVDGCDIMILVGIDFNVRALINKKVILMREFNVTGTCIPEENYMVDLTNKLEQIKTLIDAKKYFTINRGRQYGKTTTLLALERFLADEYTVISLSFEGLGETSFASEENFCREFLRLIVGALEASNYSDEACEKWQNEEVNNFTSLGEHISEVCQTSSTKYVLMVDEVDKTSNNVIFLNFLAKLREKYLASRARKDVTFHSVILAGVYDIRNIKLRLIQEGLHTPTTSETVINNSPWNIAVNFEVDMAFSPAEIATMLVEYEKDHQTGMKIEKIANEIYTYTSGYPVLVSGICKYVDEKLAKNWNVGGIWQAVKLLLSEDSPLFQSLIKNLTSNAEFADLVQKIVMNELKLSFNVDNPLVSLGDRYGYFKEINGKVKIANRVFEVRLSNYFVDTAISVSVKANQIRQVDESKIIKDNEFNMQACLEKFAEYYSRYYSQKDVAFIEREARYLFLLFISPILNGRGFAYVEISATEAMRADVIVTFLDRQFVVELKIWRGEKRHEKAYEQLLGYMDKLNLDVGYLLTFDFRQKRQPKQTWIDIDSKKQIFDIII